MSFRTAGGWIQAFEQEMNDLLSAGSGPITLHGPRFRCEVCAVHADCVWVRFDSHREHLPWKECEPTDAAHSLVNRHP